MTPSTQRHYTPSANESKHAIRSGTARTVAHRRKTTRRADPHSMATRKEPHMRCHRHRHRRRLLPSSNIGEGWWRCRQHRHQEGGQVRSSSTNVLVHLRRLKRLDPLTSKAWNFFKSWAAASQPSATTTVRIHSCSSESPSRCSGSTLSRSLTHLRKFLSKRQCYYDSAGTEDTIEFSAFRLRSISVPFDFLCTHFILLNK